MALNPGQVKIIRSTVPVLQGHGEAITAHFYKTLLTEVPSLHNVFNHANQANGRQTTALAGALYAYAAHIQDIGVLSPALQKITHKHASLFIRPEQYGVVGEYLLRAMKEVLGSGFTQDVHDAWAAAYWQLANIMIAQEKELMASTNGWTDWRTFTIVEKKRESDEISSLYLKPVDGNTLPEFKPGQYISVLVSVPQLGFLQPRQYSLSDASGKDYYRISVKKERGIEAGQAEDHPGMVSNILHKEKEVGDTIQVSHPFGEPFIDPREDSNQPLVLIAAGVGITPIISILNTVVGSGTQSRISVIQAARSTAVQAFGSHIRSMADENPYVLYTSFVKEPGEGEIAGQHYDISGRMQLEGLDRKQQLGLDCDKTLYFVCGPENFMLQVGDRLQKMGVDEARIRLELFNTGAPPVPSVKYDCCHQDLKV
jgi:nitric oxide dioxygenase